MEFLVCVGQMCFDDTQMTIFEQAATKKRRDESRPLQGTGAQPRLGGQPRVGVSHKDAGDNPPALQRQDAMRAAKRDSSLRRPTVR